MYEGTHSDTLMTMQLLRLSASCLHAVVGLQNSDTLSFVQFKLRYFAKYRCRFVEKHDADLLQVGQNVLVRMGRRMEQRLERQNCRARSDKAKQLGIMAKARQQYSTTAIQGQAVKTMQQAHNHLAI